MTNTLNLGIMERYFNRITLRYLDRAVVWMEQWGCEGPGLWWLGERKSFSVDTFTLKLDRHLDVSIEPWKDFRARVTETENASRYGGWSPETWELSQRNGSQGRRQESQDLSLQKSSWGARSWRTSSNAMRWTGDSLCPFSKLYYFSSSGQTLIQCKSSSPDPDCMPTVPSHRQLRTHTTLVVPKRKTVVLNHLQGC